MTDDCKVKIPFLHQNYKPLPYTLLIDRTYNCLNVILIKFHEQ